MKRIIVLGGGTFSPIRNHLSLAAPAFGSTARKLANLLDGELFLTKMADSNSIFISNNDVEKFIDELLLDMNVGTIVLNVAFCDFDAKPIENINSDFHAERLKTENGDVELTITPASKVISKIRKARPDIFLVGFKTTTGKTSDEQFKIALKMMKSTKCNLVLANDTVTRNNFIITPEETIYSETTNRTQVLEELALMIKMRNNLTYNRTNYIEGKNIDIKNTPINFQKVIKFLVENGGFIENNGNGFTPGHFCWKNTDTSFLSSGRKANHNLVFEEGMIEVVVSNNDIFTATGTRKPSVGARSQWLLLKSNEDYNCIIHTHNPLKPDSTMNKVEQKPFQCGSLECGLNTLNGLTELEKDIKAVYLNKHGANILFKSTTDADIIIDFIKRHIELNIKVK